MTWAPDPNLTARGIEQAERAHQAWKRELARGAPLPQDWIASPFSRAASTLEITWKSINDRRPVFREIWRETIGLHTCDKRRNRAYLAETYPQARLPAPLHCQAQRSHTDRLRGRLRRRR